MYVKRNLYIATFQNKNMNRGRKITGGKYHKLRKKKLHEKRNTGRRTTIGETKKRQMRGKGGNVKTIILRTNTANILTEKGKSKKAEIKNVLETPQNRFLARQNRLYKGAIIETSAGKAKITNRPSQEGQVNATLIAE